MPCVLVARALVTARRTRNVTERKVICGRKIRIWVSIDAVYLQLGCYTELGVKTAVFWDVTQCSLVDAYQNFGGSCSIFHQGSMMEAVLLCDMSVHLCQTVRCHVTNDNMLPSLSGSMMER